MIHNAHSDYFPGVSTVSHFAPLQYSQYHYQVYQICIYQKDLFTYLTYAVSKWQREHFIIDKPQAK